MTRQSRGDPSPAQRCVLYDDARARTFEPFATTRPLGEQRSGALLIRERWTQALGLEPTGFISGEWLDGFGEFAAPGAVPPDAELDADVLLVNTRALPFLSTGQQLQATAAAVVIDGRLAALRLRGTVPAARLRDGRLSLESLAAEQGITEREEVAGVWLDEVWDHVAQLSRLLTEDIPHLSREYGCEVLRADNTRGVAVSGTHAVWLEPGAEVEPFVLFDVTAGPVLIRRDAHVQAFTRVVGPCYVGVQSTVTADRITNCSIGDVCRVHGEVSSSIFIGHANKGHDGFVGHSIIGRWVNLGAGTITSNLKNTYGDVALWTPDGIRPSGQQFLGTMFGDHVKTGIGLRLTTGCVIGAGSSVFDAMPPKVVRPFSWGSAGAYTTFEATRFVAIAARMMRRRDVAMDEPTRRFLLGIHEHAQQDARWEHPEA
jgi:UDP-N-acetylglucosamine diphosphorylase / glucose-1-phosphate thymidylyltransferase / UDP-N-acetylgalactosamine diphosphorylase / glucosamine-1-phosphate N-acetyltransferase / galactosamine-1-phosphate N-acetyltransferase